MLNKEFTVSENLSPYDAVIAQEPCETAEPIIKACTEQNKPFFVILCGVPHPRLDGTLDKKAYEWYAYLLSQYKGCKYMEWENGRFSTECIYSEIGFNEI